MKLIDFQQLVGQIQAILTSENDPAEELLRRLADEYARTVDSVNLRLRECDECLHQGLRSEALQLAEVEPNLLDAFAVLDIPELSAWIDYIGQFGIDAPQELRLDSAAELNEAYSTAEPLEKLLRRHRRLALARGSLAERTQVVRELADLDCDNRMWREDLADYEQHRLTLVQQECEQAVRRGNYESLATLERELTETPWTVDVSPKLRAKVRREHDRLRAESAYGELTELAHQLSDSYSALDLRQGRVLFDRWNALQRLANVDPTDEVFDLAGPALDWLQDENEREQIEEEYRSTVQRLEMTLEGECDRETLDRCYHQTRGFERELPPVLEHRVLERFKALDARLKQKNRLIVISAVCVFLGVGALVTFFVRRHVDGQEIANHAGQFSQLIEAGNLSDARSYFETLEQTNPQIALTPEISGLAGQLRDAERVEDGRLQQLEQLISAAEDVIQKQPVWEELDAAAEQLKQAEQIAIAAAERARVKKVERDVSQVRRDMQNQIDNRFRTDVDDVQDAVDSLKGTSITAYSDVLSRLHELKSRNHVGAVYMSPIPGLIAKVEQEQSDTKRRLTIINDLEKISSSLGNQGQYIAALKGFAEKHPGTTRAADFERILSEESELWKGVDEWKGYRSKWKYVSMESLTSAQASSLLDDYENFTQNSGPYPGVMGLARRLEAAKAVSARKTSSQNGAVDRLEILLDSPAFDDLLSVPHTDGIFYTGEVPTVSGNRLTIKYFVDQTFAQKNTTFITKSDVIGNVARVSRSDWLSPQTQFAQKARRAIAGISTKYWEESFDEMIELVFEDTEMDPILRVLLLDNLLQIGSEGSVFMREAFKIHLDTFRQNQLPTVNWVGPKDPAADKQRSHARTFLVQMKSILGAFEKAVELRTKAEEEPLGPDMHWVGWLHKVPPVPGSTEETWTCSATATIASRHSGDLMVVHKGVQSSTKPGIIQVGSLTGGKAVLDESRFKGTTTVPELQVEGRPVYVATIN